MSIKALIFDVDGVIIESAQIKTRAYELLFADYPDKLPEMIQYHLKNAGLSRYVKVRYFYDHLLKEKLTQEREKELVDRYSNTVLEQVLKAPLVAGAREFLRANQQRYLLFVVSGTPQEEVRYILKQRSLDTCFRGIFGSPKTKPELINQILIDNQLTQKEAVFIGDAESDKIAAKEAGVPFIARLCENDDTLASCKWKIRDFGDLAACLREIDLQLQRDEDGK